MTMEPVLFSLKVYGIVIVISFLCAGLIRLIVITLSSLNERSVAKAAAQAAQAARAAAPTIADSVPITESVTADDDIPPEHVAAIAAAVHVLFEAGTILHIGDSGTRRAWVSGGRMAHHSSHNLLHGR